MKQLLILFAVLFFALPSKAEHPYLDFGTLVCISDFGAVGKIVKLDKNYFYLKVDTCVLDSLDFDTLKIQRFVNWSCGQRFGQYEVGEKELVFFRKSNYVISNYELLGYGAGGEFELPIRGDSIYYNCFVGCLLALSLDSVLTAVKDFGVIKLKARKAYKPILKSEQKQFAAKSRFHKYFIECNQDTLNLRLDVPTSRYFVNLESNYLYKDYENKISFFGLDIQAINLVVEDADVQKREGYFTVKPKAGWTKRMLLAYSKKDTAFKKNLYSQTFDVIDLPEPRIYFGEYFSDTVLSRIGNLIPRVFHYLDGMHFDENLQYELLSYTYTIKSGNSIEVFKQKSSTASPALRERINSLQPNDQIEISDVYVLYPNKTVKKIKGRSVVVGQRF
jgi:GldM C-terminal domain